MNVRALGLIIHWPYSKESHGDCIARHVFCQALYYTSVLERCCWTLYHNDESKWIPLLFIVFLSFMGARENGSG